MSKILSHSTLISVLTLPVLMITSHSVAANATAEEQTTSKTLSAVRKPSESYQDARDRVMGKTIQTRSTTSGAAAKVSSAEQTATLLDDSQVTTLTASVKAWTFNTTQDFNTATFSKWKDHYLNWTNKDTNTTYLRRISWRYPQDGCFARAELFNRHIADSGQPKLQKIFVFGDLAVKTANAPGGKVTWWYHVAPVVQVDKMVYVVDPAISNSAPMLAKDWLNTVVSASASPTTARKTLKVAICDANAYAPNSTCTGGSALSDASLNADKTTYLNAEWSNIKNLNLDPITELTTN